MKLCNWKEMLEKRMAENGESWDDVEANTLAEQDMVREFNCRTGVEKGEPFTMWTKNHVYFPVCFDGSEWVGSVSRNPDGKPTQHHGGG